jgi:thymidylate synthase (FAD)
MAHCVVPEAEEILDKEYRVLDRGFVRLVDYCGGDARIVQSARVSYGHGTKTVREDAALIDYLMRNEHLSPFEQVVLTFHVKMPIFVARQWVRHRTARLNEISGRYSVMQNEFYVPDAGDVALQSDSNKQGRADKPAAEPLAERTRTLFKKCQEDAYAAYEELIDAGIAREIARMNLPLSLYTQVYWQMDLRNLFHFLKLRLDSHAQMEIRAYAAVMLEMTRKVAPAAVAAFENHALRAVNFSGEEMDELRARIGGGAPDKPPAGRWLEGRLLERFEEKLREREGGTGRV